jgi:hypothetical protein
MFLANRGATSIDLMKVWRVALGVMVFSKNLTFFSTWSEILNSWLAQGVTAYKSSTLHV